jgi:hypothetical protein
VKRVSRRAITSKFGPVIETIRRLEPSTEQSFLVPFTSSEEMANVRAQIWVMAKREGFKVSIRLERDADNRLAGLRIWRLK